MNLAAISLAALFLAIFLSCVTNLNIGIVCIAMAWFIGVYLGGFSIEQIAAGFPSQLFLTLAGMTLLFTQAQLNGTLEKLAQRAVVLCRGDARLIPIAFFAIAAILASVGPGNIATAALIAPVAMAVAGRAGVSVFVMALMVGNGAGAGSLSPFAPTGIIVNGLMQRAGMPGLEWQTYWSNLAAHALVAFAGYALFGGLRLRRAAPLDVVAAQPETSEFGRNNWITLAVIAALILSVLLFGVHVGMGAFAAAALLALVRVADHGEAIRKVPWNVILMVGGVTVLISLLERTQGLALFTDLLARIATRDTITGAIAFVTGAVSVYSSTSGVVLPAFLPTVPGLAAQLGGADPAAIALSMNIGSHLVDVSPLSTIGALCVAAAPIQADARKLFNALLAWGLSMTLAGALICYAMFRA